MLIIEDKNKETKPTIIPTTSQQECIDTIDGMVMVLAGPGTGKTFTLVKRIENMIDKKIAPSSILCLTFSDTAAKEMKARLIKDVGILASAVNVYTYHSFCSQIIKSYPMKFELSDNVNIITETFKRNIMKKCVEEYKPKYFTTEKGDIYFHIPTLLKAIPEIKKQQINKEEYFKSIETHPDFKPLLEEKTKELEDRIAQGKSGNIGREKEIAKIKLNIQKAIELWDIYELYLKKTFEQNFIDFEDMINLVIKQFKEDTGFLKEIANNYEYILVDEYQDTNKQQNSIIFSLLDGLKNKNIFVVGDDDQIIYGFQGADLGNIENFLKLNPDTKVICLNDNNRSTQTVLDLSYKIISLDESRLENNPEFNDYGVSKKLTAKNQKVIEKETPVRLWNFNDELQEYIKIVDDIEALIKSGTAPLDKDENIKLSEIAILARRKSNLAFFAQLLEARGIRVQLPDGKNIFTIKSSILLYNYLKLLYNAELYGESVFGLLLSPPFDIDNEDYILLLKESKITYKGFVYNMHKLLSNQYTKWENVEKIKKFITDFDYLKEFASKNNLQNTMLEIINRTGILACFVNSNVKKTDNIAGIKVILNEANVLFQLNSTIGLYEFIMHLNYAFENDVEINTDKPEIINNAVQLVTYHGSKGREYEHVYLPNLTNNAWEDYTERGGYKLVINKPTTPDKKRAELLKLLFVGITRAKHTLTLSFPNMQSKKANRLTQLIAEVEEFKFDNKIFEADEEELISNFVKSVSTTPVDYEKAFKDEITARTMNITMSPSSLNTYLSCPRSYFYQKILGIRLQFEKKDAANFGTALHSTLEYAANYAKAKNAYPSIDEIKEQYLKNLLGVMISEQATRENLIKQGLAILDSYYPKFTETVPETLVATEFLLENVQIENISLIGKIDRIERFKDGTFGLYDYKSGDATSDAQINIGTGREDYFRQLCFYKYAYEKMTGNKVSQVGLIFIKNHSKNVYKTLIEEDNTYIENLIKETCANIQSLKFEKCEGTNHTNCKNCSYKLLCALDVV